MTLNPELYRIVFAVSLLSLVLMVLNGQNVREHMGQENMEKQKRMFLYPGQRLYRSGKMGGRWMPWRTEKRDGKR